MELNKDTIKRGVLGDMCGLRLIEEPKMIIQKRKHRRKRINKKWLKRYGTRPDPKLLLSKGDNLMSSFVMGHPATINRLIKLSTKQMTVSVKE